MKLEFSGQIFKKSSNIQFHKNLSSESRVPLRLLLRARRLVLRMHRSLRLIVQP